MIVLFFFPLLLASTTSGVTNSLCPASWLRFKNKCYKLLEEYATFAKASDLCIHTYGGHLPRIWSQEEQDFVEDNFMDVEAVPRYHIWLGAMRVSEDNDDTSFIWTGGLKINYTHWYPGEPNFNSHDQFCVALWGSSDHFATWWDTTCTAKCRVLCEKNLMLGPPQTPLHGSNGDPDSVGIEFEIRSMYKQVGHLQAKKATYSRIMWVLILTLFALIVSICFLFKFGEYSYLRMVIANRGQNMFTKFKNASTASVNQASESTSPSS